MLNFGNQKIIRDKTGQKTLNLTLPLVFALALVIAYTGAHAWQRFEAQDPEIGQPSNTDNVRYISALVNNPRDVSALIAPVSNGPMPEPPSAPSQAAGEDDSIQPEIDILLDLYGAPLPESDPVENSYFDDAVFLGDSITEGIKLYQMMENSTVLASRSINLTSVFTSKVIKTTGGDNITIMEALALLEPEKIYIQLGANALASDLSSFVSSYGKVIDAVKEMHPNSVIYIQSIFPITADLSQRRPEISNERINNCNEALLVLAGEKQVFFVDVATAFKNEQGVLPHEASPNDGMHFGPTYYRKWFDYLKMHTISPIEEPDVAE